MKTLSTQSKWQPWKGFVLQAAAFAMLITAGAYLQRVLGLTGLVLSELMFLILAVGYTLAKKTPLKEVFPIHVPKIRDFFGVLFLWGGGIMLGMLSIYLMGIIFPDIFMEVLTGLNNALTGVHPLILFFIVAVLAPVCVESIVRGAVLSHFRGLKHQWMTVVIIGIFFGIMHADPIRFVNTSILGGICAYLMVRRDNFLLPLMLHFVNNSFGEVISAIEGDSYDPEAAIEALRTIDMVMALGATMIVFFAAPFLVAAGVHLMQDKLAKDAPLEKRRERSSLLQRNYIIAMIFALALLIGGSVILATNPTFREMYSGSLSKVTEELLTAVTVFL